MKKHEILTEILKNQRLYEKANQLLDLLERAGEITYSLDCAKLSIDIETTVYGTGGKTGDEYSGSLNVTETLEEIRGGVNDVLSHLINQSKQFHSKYKLAKK